MRPGTVLGILNGSVGGIIHLNDTINLKIFHYFSQPPRSAPDSLGTVGLNWFRVQFPEDFCEPPNYPCLSTIENFCRRVMPGSELDCKVQRYTIICE